MNESKVKAVQEKRLREFCKAIFVKAGVPLDQADIVVDALVTTDLQGVITHGVIGIPRYVSLIKSGAARAAAKIEVVQDGGSVALWDGCGSLGQVLSVWAMEKCMEKASSYGIGAVGVKRSNHLGACAYYAMKALDEDMIGIALTGASPGMAPWGGCEPLIGNNPLGVAIPCGKEPPIVLDMAMSIVAGMKIQLLKREKKTKIPLEWGALNKEGEVTDNIAEFLEQPLLMPVGAYKGFGLALVIDVLAGVLLGAGYGFPATDGEEGPGHFFIAIKVDRFRPLDEFKEAMDKRVQEFKSSKLAEGFDRILMPGQLEFETEMKRKKEGIPLPYTIVQELNHLAESLDIEDRL